MNENSLSPKGFLVWGICALFFLYEFFLRTVIGTYQHPVMLDLGLSSFQFSILSTTIFLLIYGIMQIPAGLIVDKIGLKKSLLIGSFACSLSSVGFAYAYSYPIAIFFRLFMGFGASFGFICLLVAVYDWMPHRYSAIFIGLSQLIGTVGPMAAAGPLDSLTESTGVNWRYVFICLGLIGMVIGILVQLFVDNNRQKSGKFILLRKPESVLTSIKRLFSRSQPWFIALLSASLYFTIEYLSENEGRSFLSLKGISMNKAAYMITTSWIGYAVGCPLLGFFSDMLQRRKVILQIAAVTGLISIISIMYFPQEEYIRAAFFFLGISASGQSIGFALTAEQFKKQFVAVGFGLNNAMITVISAVNAPLIGLLIDHKKAGIYPSLEEYQTVFNLLIVVAGAAVILSTFFIKETYCKSAVDFTYLSQK